jgi:hypothetical protein
MIGEPQLLSKWKESNQKHGGDRQAIFPNRGQSFFPVAVLACKKKGLGIPALTAELK